MHCPECGQQQINDEIRFCSRCGFPLAGVAQVVANRGALPYTPEDPAGKNWLTRKKGIFVSIVWLLFFIFSAGMLDELKAPGELVSLIAILGIFSGIVMIIGSAFFLKPENERSGNYSDPRPYEMGGGRHASALPPQQSIPVQNYAQPVQNRWKTNDLVQPSVTEGTTKLLDNE